MFAGARDKQNLARRLLALRPHLVKFWHLFAFMIFIRKPLRVEDKQTQPTRLHLSLLGQPGYGYLSYAYVRVCLIASDQNL